MTNLALSYYDKNDIPAPCSTAESMVPLFGDNILPFSRPASRQSKYPIGILPTSGYPQVLMDFDMQSFDPVCRTDNSTFMSHTPQAIPEIFDDTYKTPGPNQTRQVIFKVVERRIGKPSHYNDDDLMRDF